MPAGVALGDIYAAVRTILLEDATLATLLAPDVRNITIPGIYTEGAVPQGAAMPYLTIGAGTQVPAHTMGMPNTARYGWNCTIQLKAVGQGRGDDQGFAILDAVGQVVFEGRDLIATGSPGSPGLLTEYGYGWCDEWTVQPTLISIVQGKTTREWPAILRVIVHD